MTYAYKFYSGEKQSCNCNHQANILRHFIIRKGSPFIMLDAL